MKRLSRGLTVGFLLLLCAALAMTAPALYASSEGGHGGGEKKEAGKAENGVITIGPLTVNILSNKGYRFFRLSMVVQCDSNSDAERLLLPDVRQDLVFTLSSKLAEDLLTNSGKMVLRQELIKLFDKYAGEGKVKNLYFQEFVFQ